MRDDKFAGDSISYSDTKYSVTGLRLLGETPSDEAPQDHPSSLVRVIEKIGRVGGWCLRRDVSWIGSGVAAGRCNTSSEFALPREHIRGEVQTVGKPIPVGIQDGKSTIDGDIDTDSGGMGRI